MYASFGVSALLNDAGMSTQIIGGDFICAVVAKDGSRMTLQGFGGKPGGMPSHYWVEAQGTLLDLGPMYLPCESSFPAAPLPVLRWPAMSQLPDFVAYRERVRYAGEAQIANPEFRQRNAEFVSYCREVGRAHSGSISLGTWQLRDFQSLHQAATAGDSWARAVMVFLRRSLKAEFPF
jgi:hypothetical protein